MSDPAPEPQPMSRGVPYTLLLILVFGAIEAGIVYALLAFDTPLAALARQAARSWPGRVVLALIGWVLISVAMIAALTIIERRRARRSSERAV